MAHGIDGGIFLSTKNTKTKTKTKNRLSAGESTPYDAQCSSGNQCTQAAAALAYRSSVYVCLLQTVDGVLALCAVLCCAVLRTTMCLFVTRGDQR